MMNKRIILLGILFIVALVVSGCAQQPPQTTGTPTGEIKSEGDAQKTVQNITNDVQDLGNTLNELDNVFD